MRPTVAVSVVEACYRLDLDETAWLDALCQACEPLAPAGMVRARTVMPGKDGFVYQACVRRNESDEVTQLIDALEGGLPPPIVRSFNHRVAAETASEWTVRLGVPLSFLDKMYEGMHRHGLHDAFNLIGGDVRCGSVCVTVGLDRHTSVHHRARDVWERVSAHLAAGLRLRTSLGGEPGKRAIESADAVLAPDGKCVHAAGTATRSLEALRTAARGVDRARTRQGREDAATALELWQGLFAGRWSLIDAFDSDGRRFIVAHRNAPELVEDRALTRREQQAATLAALCQADELVGYSLGLSARTVRTHLARAMRKLGVRDRAELVRLAEVLLDRTLRGDEQRFDQSE